MLVKEETIFNGVLELTKDTLNGTPMGFDRSMHVWMHLINIECNIGACECQILKGTDNLRLLRRIRKLSALCFGKGCGCRERHEY